MSTYLEVYQDALVSAELARSAVDVPGLLPGAELRTAQPDVSGGMRLDTEVQPLGSYVTLSLQPANTQNIGLCDETQTVYRARLYLSGPDSTGQDAASLLYAAADAVMASGAFRSDQSRPMRNVANFGLFRIDQFPPLGLAALLQGEVTAVHGRPALP